jgi:hypothetical protein
MIPQQTDCSATSGNVTERSTVELTVDFDTVTVHSPVPGCHLLSQSFEIRDSPTAQTLPREDPDLDLRLIEPASVSRPVTDDEAIPDFVAIAGPKPSASAFRRRRLAEGSGRPACF